MKPISAQSKEWVRMAVWAKESGLPEDPTVDTTVQMAFAVDKASATWVNAEWETDNIVNPDVFYARSLVGPGTNTQLVAGTKYYVGVKISGTGVAPEAPVLWANLRLGVDP